MLLFCLHDCFVCCLFCIAYSGCFCVDIVCWVLVLSFVDVCCVSGLRCFEFGRFRFETCVWVWGFVSPSCGICLFWVKFVILRISPTLIVVLVCFLFGFPLGFVLLIELLFGVTGLLI